MSSFSRARRLLLLSVLVFTATQPLAADLPSGDVWLQHVSRDLLPFWSGPDALGTPVGNFPTFRCNDGRLPDAKALCDEIAHPPGWIRPEIGREFLRMKARQTYGYGVAFHLTGERRWLDAAWAGARYTMGWLDAERGAPVWIQDGRPASFNQTSAQDQAYAVVGIAMLYYLTRDAQLERALITQERFIFDKLWDPERKLIRWLPKQADSTDAERDELVAQLDQLNAYMLLVVPYLSAADRERWHADIRRLCDVIVQHYHDPASSTFFGTRNAPDSERPGSRHNDFGHTIKAYWMLLIAARELDDAKLEAFARDGGTKVLERAWHTPSQSWGSSWTRSGIDANKSWWIFAELDQMATTLALADRSQARYLPTAWAFWLDRMVDHRDGEVWGWVSADGWVPPDSLKIHHWKSGYHSFEHALVSYLGAQALNQQTATLHFATGRSDALFRPYVLPGKVVSVRKAGAIEVVTFRLDGVSPSDRP